MSALYFSPMAITFVITNLSVGRFGGTDARRTLFAGAVLATGGTLLSYAACMLVPSTVFTPAYIIPGLIVLGLGQGLFMTPVMNAVLTEIPEAHTGGASGVLNTIQRVGNAMGVAILEIPFAVLGRASTRGSSRPGLHFGVRLGRGLVSDGVDRSRAVAEAAVAVDHVAVLPLFRIRIS
jgi:MFS family permease